MMPLLFVTMKKTSFEIFIAAFTNFYFWGVYYTTFTALIYASV